VVVLEPIFESDLQDEQYAYRPGRSAQDALGRIGTLLLSWFTVNWNSVVSRLASCERHPVGEIAASCCEGLSL